MLEGEHSCRFYQLSQLTVSGFMKTVIMYEKLVKQFTTEVAHTDDSTSTLKLLLQQRTSMIKNESRLHAEDLQASFAETNHILDIQTMTLLFKNEIFNSPLTVILSQELKSLFNDKLYI